MVICGRYEEVLDGMGMVNDGSKISKISDGYARWVGVGYEGKAISSGTEYFGSGWNLTTTATTYCLIEIEARNASLIVHLSL